MRNVLIHGYDVVREEVLWEVAQRDVPQLVAQIETILGQLDSPDSQK